jgi:hypothetical protein
MTAEKYRITLYRIPEGLTEDTVREEDLIPEYRYSSEEDFDKIVNDIGKFFNENPNYIRRTFIDVAENTSV